MANGIVYNGLRVCFLGENILRIEKKGKNGFCDENTFFIPDRNKFPLGGSGAKLRGNVLIFGEYTLYLPKDGNLSGLRLEKNGQEVYFYQPIENSGELPPPFGTPEVFPLTDCPRILIPEGGYSKHRKGEYQIDEGAEDLYLLLSGGDPKLLRRLYVELTGRCELVRLSTLGGWNSKYFAYSEETAKQLILDYEKYGVPLDVMVIDTDWRKSDMGWGYDINTELFPDMERFIRFAHGHGVEIVFNDHPEPVDGAHVFEPEEIAYRERNLQSLMEKGLDIWWYDRNWHTHLISPTKVKWETFGLYLYHDITENYYKKISPDKRRHRRPVIMGNVVNIENGEYDTIADSASHRYSVQWTGDIASMPCSLAQEVENLVRCTENCIPYMNSDCGGHVGDPDKEQFIRWMQYGTLSPVFRPHCCNTVKRFREPWLYDEETLDIVREYELMRYRLLPVLYTEAYEAYKTGVGLFRSLPLEYPRDPKAVRRDEYLLGKNLLIAPIGGTLLQPLSGDVYTTPVSVTYYNGTEWQGEPIAGDEWKKIYLNLRHESPKSGVPVYHFSAKIKAKIKLPEAKRLYIKNDDGAVVYLDGKCIFEDKNMHSAMLSPLTELEAGREYTLEIDYFQGGGEAFLGLFTADICDISTRETYLPEGRWLDVFDGKIYEGNSTVSRGYGLKEMPLFVRLGAVLPLAYSAKNTKQQSFGSLVFDFYPAKGASDEGYLYEDDGETTAYLLGEFRTSAYAAGYDEKDQAFKVTLEPAKGDFVGERAVKRRKITVKYHLLAGAENVERVTVNGEEVAFARAEKDASAFPLGTDASSSDSATLTLSFEADVKKAYEIKFYLNK